MTARSERRARLLAAYRRLLRKLDRRFREKASIEPGALACRAGCFPCCVGLFEITPLDAALAGEGLRALPPAVRGKIRRRSEENLSRIVPDFPGNPKTLALDPIRESEWDDFFERTSQMACPFLVEAPDASGMLCAIYEHRPYTCRTFGLALEDAGRIVSPACRLNFRGRHRRSRLVLQMALPARDPADDRLAAHAEKDLGYPSGGATVLPAVAAGRSPWGRS